MPSGTVQKTRSASAAWAGSLAVWAAVCAVYVGCAATVLYQQMGRPATGMDDANIFFVYARNFVHGHGIVYAVGGEHVEGFTSFLYFVLCSVCFALLRNPETLLLVLNIAAAIGAALLVVHVLNTLGKAADVNLTTRLVLMAGVVAWVCANPAWLAWNAISLMDSGLYGLMIAWALPLAVAIALGTTWPHAKLQVSLAAAGLVLVRPEGLAWALVLAGWWFWLHPGDAKARLTPAAAMGGTLIALVVFRLAYFGYPLPNTYYAKVSASLGATLGDGFDYLWRFTGMYGAAVWLPVLAGVACAAWAVWHWKTTPGLARALMAVVGFTLMGLALPVLEGGDHFMAFRLFQPVWPLLGLCAALPVVIFVRLRGVPFAAASVAIMALAMFFTDIVSWPYFLADNSPDVPLADVRVHVLNEFQIATRERVNGEELSALFAPDLPTVGFGSAGGIAYGYQGHVYDMMGLNDTRMAHAQKVKTGPKGHQSFDENVFFEIAPDVLMPRAAGLNEPVDLAAAEGYYTNPSGWDNLIFKDLFNHARFRALYVMALVTPRNGQPGFQCFGYFNRAYLARLAATGKFQIRTAS